MKMKWSRLHIVLLVGVILVAVLAYFIGHLAIVTPLQTDMEQAKEQLRIQQQILGQQTDDNRESVGVTTDLQRSFPVEKKTDQLLLLLNQVAVDSDSSIDQYSVVSSSGIDPVIETDPSLEMLTYQLRVTSPNYNQMFAFLDRLRNSQRFTHIKHLQFTGQGEEQINFVVTVSTYYTPTLYDLKIEAPS